MILHHLLGTLVFHLISVMLLFGCGTATDRFNHHAFLCGQDFGSPLIKYTTSDGSKLNDKNTRVLIRSQESKMTLHETALNEKGCLKIPKEIIWDRVLVTTIDNRLGARVSATESAAIYGGNVAMEPRSRHRPRVECGNEVVFGGSLLLSNFVDLSGIDYPDFVSIQLEVMDINERTLQSLEVWGDQTFEPQLAPNLAPGLYLMNIGIIDRSQDNDPVNATCRFFVDHGTPVVRLGNKIVSHKTYFGMEFGVVSSGYEINFHFEGTPANFEIEYCLLSIDPTDTYVASKECPANSIQTYSRNELPDNLDSGLWEVGFRAAKRGHPPGNWQFERIVVNVLCPGNYNDPHVILAKKCTEIQGSVSLEGMGIGDTDINKLGLVSVVRGNLTIRETAIIEPQGLKHLSHAGSLRIALNPNLTMFSFENLRTIQAEMQLTGMPDKESLFEFKALENILGRGATLRGLYHLPKFHVPLRIRGGLTIASCFFSKLQGMERIIEISDLYVHGNEFLQELEGFNSLVSIRGLAVVDNPKLQKISRFRSLRSLTSLEISRAPELRTVDLPKLDLDSLTLDLNQPVSLGWIRDLRNIRTLHLSGKWAPTLLQVLKASLTVTNLRIGRSSFVDLSNISPLLKMSGTLTISRNESLVEFDTSRLPGIIPKSIDFEDNPALEKIHIPYVQKSLYRLFVTNSPRLHQLTGFEDLRIIEYWLSLKNLGLRELAALRGLKQVSDGISLKALPNLESLDWLEELESAPLLEVCFIGNNLTVPEAIAAKFDRIERKRPKNLRQC